MFSDLRWDSWVEFSIVHARDWISVFSWGVLALGSTGYYWVSPGFEDGICEFSRSVGEKVKIQQFRLLQLNRISERDGSRAVGGFYLTR